jgi:6-pyruvoyltetrahydropterin/6-carboxytetrahydropterin synthase
VNVELKRIFSFESAHFLPRVPEGHKCRRMHGHSYRVELFVSGPVDPQTGWLIDFADLDEAWAPLHAQFDHHVLNDVPGLENSTCEVMAVFIFDAIRKRVPQLSAVTVWETSDSACTYRGAN